MTTVNLHSMASASINGLDARKKVQLTQFFKDTRLFKTLKMALSGMTMTDFKIFALIVTQPMVHWNDIEMISGGHNTEAVNALNKLCSSNSVCAAHRYGLVMKVKNRQGETIFALTDKGQQFSQLFR
ncbi:hypothetical protein [Endozoicomonas ascidiicola]|uniref:hypothetical protein n=1 Tax=Endozoicomonas ascidiicola TaxID=1698521 RepID=UPI000B24DFE7|nr:hypothetical protein [Endozoicomonas ascidiicola]